MAIRFTGTIKTPEQIAAEFRGTIKTGQQMIEEQIAKSKPRAPDKLPDIPPPTSDTRTPRAIIPKEPSLEDISVHMSGKNAIFSVRIDQALIDSMRNLPGKLANHVERALLDYLRNQ
jgi:hypothetical protein